MNRVLCEGARREFPTRFSGFKFGLMIDLENYLGCQEEGIFSVPLSVKSYTRVLVFPSPLSPCILL